VRVAAPAPSAAPAPVATAPARPAPAAAPAPAPPALDTGGGFEAFVAELARTFGALATLFKKHGAASLVDEGGGRVRVRMAGLTPGEERLLADKRNLRALELAYARAFGLNATLEFTAGTGPARAEVERPVVSKDLFTQRIASDFEGTVEDLG
jgi:hypothetical protein